MMKTGKRDAYWVGVMQLYAQGKFRFTTGKRPGDRRWKAVIQQIDACLLTPVFNQKVRTIDVFGKKIPCKCGYHKSNVVNFVGKRSRFQLGCLSILKKVMIHYAKHRHLHHTNYYHSNRNNTNHNMRDLQRHTNNHHFSHNSALDQCNTPSQFLWLLPLMLSTLGLQR
ncbi:hypothetical protein ATANTOWER_029397 [Ataeniobius toweri]|uniref:Uncharacterized protein n=1 Tax=Ataeniobius toweri TaxID=208326 RepID=A0ABU7BIQ7_9TELE|nr:hypothetical protein [Ataeniobius toweri]